MGNSKSIAQLLVRDLPKDLPHGIYDGFLAAAKRAYNSSKTMNIGHIRNVLGQNRHFELNEAFHTVLNAQELEVSDLKGNKIVQGKVGIWNLARFTANDDKWLSAKRSSLRRELAKLNISIESLVYSDLFKQDEKPIVGTVFFVTCFSKNLQAAPQIYLAVCDHQMNNWLFVEEIMAFSNRYEININGQQIDNAIPTLKKRKDKDGTLE